MNLAALILIATLNGGGSDVASVDDRPYAPADYNASDYTTENPAPWVPNPAAQYRIVRDGDWSTLPLTSSQPFPKQNGWTIDATHATRVWVMASRITVAEISGGLVVRTFSAPDNYAMNPATERLVIQGVPPAPSAANKQVTQTGWTVEATTATRVWGEQTIPSITLVARKREHAREIMEQAMANETEPDFTVAGITNCPIATKQWVSGQVGGTPSWAAITGKPTTISGFGIIDAVATNDARLADARNPLAHTHTKANITDFAHTHAPADITGTAVVTADARLSDARTPLAHNQSADTITDSATKTVMLLSERTKLTGIATGAQVNADITKAEIEAKLTGVIASHSHSGGGSDPWTYVKLGADFTTSLATAVDVTGLAFTPLANTTYVIEGLLLTRTVTATVGPRPGCAWPTGLTDGVARIDVTSAAGTNVMTNGNISAAVLAPVGGLPTTTGSWPGKLDAVIVAGATPLGSFRIQLASETAATNVTMKAGSFIRYRTY